MEKLYRHVMRQASALNLGTTSRRLATIKSANKEGSEWSIMT